VLAKCSGFNLLQKQQFANAPCFREQYDHVIMKLQHGGSKLTNWTSPPKG